MKTFGRFMCLHNFVNVFLFSRLWSKGDNPKTAYRCTYIKHTFSLQDCLTLQEDLTSLGQWEADWQVKFNVAKCHSMRVTRH